MHTTLRKRKACLLISVILWFVMLTVSLILNAWIVSGILIGLFLYMFQVYLLLQQSRRISSLRKQITDHARNTYIKSDLDFSQIESLLGLYNTLNPKLILPSTRGWAASPDFLALICNWIFKLQHKSRDIHILEASSGVSSVVIGYCLAKKGRGNLTSLENDESYMKKTRQMILDHALEGYVDVVHAPLVTHELKDQRMRWYNLENLKKSHSFDLVVVDGPPVTEGKYARFPCLPLIYNFLHNDAVILLDDADRQSERLIVDEWLKLYPEWSCQFVELEKGAAILSRSGYKVD